MIAQRPSTPEKELLKLIEEPKHKGAAGVAAARHRGLSLISFTAWISRLAFLKTKLKERLAEKGAHQLDLVKVVNKALALLVFILSLTFIFNFIYSMDNLKKMPNLELKAKEGLEALGPKEALPLYALSDYLDKIRQRDIFKMGAKRTLPGDVQAPTPKIVEATQHLRLVGISWSNDPDAMIEDTKALRTFFVKRGQMIGSVKVQAILKDRVILSYGGEEVDLR